MIQSNYTEERRDEEWPEQYVGYMKKAPPGIARFLRAKIYGIVLVVVGLAGMVSLSQGRFAAAFFEFGNVREFEGMVHFQPYPTLLVSHPMGENSSSQYILVAPGKHGADSLVGEWAGQRVGLKGTLVYRDNQTMIEIVPGSVTARSGEAKQVQLTSTSLGRFTLRGEIVDSKCFLGVMNPGNLKPHRACAVRCISGGIPPVFLVRNQQGRALYFLLVGEDGRTVNKEVLDLVAEPLDIDGEITREGQTLVLRANPADYRRVN